MKKLFKAKGQNLAEYAIVIFLAAAVFVTMQTYVKRGIQGSFKDIIDDFGNQSTEKSSGAELVPQKGYLGKSQEYTVSNLDEAKISMTGGKSQRNTTNVVGTGSVSIHGQGFVQTHVAKEE